MRSLSVIAGFVVAAVVEVIDVLNGYLSVVLWLYRCPRIKGPAASEWGIDTPQRGPKGPLSPCDPSNLVPIFSLLSLAFCARE